jgi:hypothetical protein
MSTIHSEEQSILQRTLSIKELILKEKTLEGSSGKTKGKGVLLRRLFYPRTALSLAFLEFWEIRHVRVVFFLKLRDSAGPRSLKISHWKNRLEILQRLTQIYLIRKKFLMEKNSNSQRSTLM